MVLLYGSTFLCQLSFDTGIRFSELLVIQRPIFGFFLFFIILNYRECEHWIHWTVCASSEVTQKRKKRVHFCNQKVQAVNISSN